MPIYVKNMSRTKKSRKPSFAPTSAPKEDKKKTVILSDKKPKKKNGKQSGNRQKEAFESSQTSGNNNQPKDPRIGSKKPIDLGVPVRAVTNVKKAKANKKTPIAAIREVDNNDALEQEIYAIEDDSQLQAILAKQDDDIALTEAEVDFFNEKMTRHEELRQALGWNDDEEDETANNTMNGEIDEDALWDKLDKPDMSDFE